LQASGEKYSNNFARQSQVFNSSVAYPQVEVEEITDRSEKHKKLNINDILKSFKKEKEQFDEKLHQLRNKLETVKQPEPQLQQSK
jgi:hypothetical protein